MAAFATYSTTPASNTTIGGINSAEGCPAANVNDIARQIVAEGRQLYDLVNAINVSGYMPLAGGTFTGNVLQTGAGAHRYNASSSLTSGATYFLPTGSARPTAAEGVVVFYY